MASTQIPDQLKQDLPPTIWGKVLGATPVIMTVIATALAGLASSELNKAQYDRSWAAQLQAKASDQWSFFQAKRLRGVLQGDVAEIKSTGEPAAPAPRFQTKSAQGDMPLGVRNAIQAVASGKSDEEIDGLVDALQEKDIIGARQLATQRSLQFDAEVAKTRQPPGAVDRLRFAAARYDAESRLDQDVAYVYELLVRKSNLSARRHHERSQKFFYGMLLGQMAVIISTFALAARKRSLLWSLAAAAGAIALSFSVYIYLCT